MAMILSGQVEPTQLGAFLMLMRVKEESPEELAGFVRAARRSLNVPDASRLKVDLDWSSYAGKRRQLPWFLLSALLLAQNGIRIFMHGITGTQQRVYTPLALQCLGITPARTWDEAAQHLAARNFAYMSLPDLQPRLAELINLRRLLGLRSPVHTLCRLLNPCQAPYVLQGIFHPPYKYTHQQAALLLEQPHCAVLKGEGGEIERNPDSVCEVLTVHGGETAVEMWPAFFATRHIKDEVMDVQRLQAVWQGREEDEYGAAAIIGTAAIALKLLGRAETLMAAEDLARKLYLERL